MSIFEDFVSLKVDHKNCLTSMSGVCYVCFLFSIKTTEKILICQLAIETIENIKLLLK